jgi:gas vesicle protein
MFEKDDSASTALISFLLGGVAGAALAVLFVPTTGRDTRRLISEGVRDGAERSRALARRGKAALDAAGRAVTGAVQHPAPGNGQELGEVERVPEPGLPSTSGGPGFVAPA